MHRGEGRHAAAGERLVRDPEKDFAHLAGSLSEPLSGEYVVEYRKLSHPHPLRWRTLTMVGGAANIGFFAAYASLLVLGIKEPSHSAGPLLIATDMLQTVSVLLMAGLSMVNVVSFTVASNVARDPVPVVPEAGRRVAFVTAIVPSKEPMATALRTLEAAQLIVYDGVIDVWLLDEGGSDHIRAQCEERGIKYFSRHGLRRYNTRSGRFKTRSKHGNYNAWIHAHGTEYEFMASVDNDHTPCAAFLERTLGYMRDANVAFVVGPQAYGNSQYFIAKAAESQQFPFHSIIQRAANFYRVPMLVGTNYVIRLSALIQIGGFVDSVTEDMATGIRLHASKNPATGRRWRSVYTPDVLSVGEGPTTWRDYFSQQGRWSRGTFDVLKIEMPRRCWRLGLPALFHYLLIANFYPSMALMWLLGALNAVLNLTLGADGISVPVEAWTALYVDTSLFQLWVYARNRRYNVSPVEEQGTFGLIGMLMSVLASPIYAAALLKSLVGRRIAFAVTPKGTASGVDSFASFKLHFIWLAVFACATAYALVHRQASFPGGLWPAALAATCLLPPLLYSRDISRRAVPQPLIRRAGSSGRRSRPPQEAR